MTVSCFQSHRSHYITADAAHLSSWSGEACDQKCKDLGGFPCGRLFKDCCKSTDSCVGVAWKECEEGHIIPVDCSAEAPTFTNIKKMMGQEAHKNPSQEAAAGTTAGAASGAAVSGSGKPGQKP